MAMSSKRLSYLWGGLVLMTPVLVLAANLTIPNNFSANTQIQAAQMNANFAAVQTAVNSKQDATNVQCLAGQAVTAISQNGTTTCAAPVTSKIVNLTVHQNSTRMRLPVGASIAMESFLVNKLSATSNLIIEGSQAMWGAYSVSMTQGWKYGTATEVTAQGPTYTGQPHFMTVPTMAVISGYTTTGSQIMSFRYYNVSGTGSDQPAVAYNPNASDDARLAQTQSTYLIWEVEP